MGEKHRKDDLPPPPGGTGAPAGSNKTQDWSSMDAFDLPSGSGAPAGSNKTQDWSAMDGLDLPPPPGGSGAPAGSNKTQDWSSMDGLDLPPPPGGTGQTNFSMDADLLPSGQATPVRIVVTDPDESSVNDQILICVDYDQPPCN